MACKHEGGNDLCVRYKGGDCKARKNSPENRRRVNEYHKLHRGFAYAQYPHATPGNMGQAGEHLVAFDLLRRGMEVTKPLNTNGAHDLHAQGGGKWHNVQVKVGVVNKKTGAITQVGIDKREIESDILAIVDVVGARVRYVPLTIPELPKEFRDAAL